MLDLNNLRKEKFEGVCKILDYVLVVLFAVFFILSLFPYFSVSKGDPISSKGFGNGEQTTESGKAIESKASEDDAWSLLGYVGFPYNHESVGEWQEDMYKVNKKAVKENEENGYKGLIKGTLGKLGVQFANKKGEKNPMVDLDVPGITTKTVSIKQVGSILFLVVFALVNIAWLILAKGATIKALACTCWGVLGIIAYNSSYLLNMSTNAVRMIMLIVVFAVTAVALVDSVLYIIDGRSRAAYLRSVSAAYA